MPRALSRLELAEILERASLRSERDAALIAGTFLTAARISEILGLRVDDIATIGDIMLVQLRILKRRGDKEVRKVIPIEAEDPFAPYFWDYALEAEGPLVFKMDRTTAWRICRRYGFHPHELRHSRLTELGQYMPESVLKAFAGWKIKGVVGIYLHYGWRQFLPFVRQAARDAETALKSAGLRIKLSYPPGVPGRGGKIDSSGE